MDTCTHPEHLNKIKRQALRDVSSSCAMWQNLSALSIIERTRLNGNNSHPRFSSEPLIENEQAHQTGAPNFLPIYTYVLRRCK